MDEKIRELKLRLLEKLMSELEDYDAETIPKRRLPPLEEPEEDLEMAMNPEMEEEMEEVVVPEKEGEEEEEEMLPGFLRRVQKERAVRSKDKK